MKTLLLCTLILMSYFGNADDLEKVKDLRGTWKFSIGDNPRWAQKDFDDSDWEDIFVPARWEDEGFAGFDGYAWYRTTVDLSNISIENLYLVLGYIDDVDEVFLNGQLIGFSGSFPPRFYTAYNANRQYYIPPSLINKNGKNVIAVRIYDSVLDGGMVKGNMGIYTRKDALIGTMMLEGVWKFKEGDNQSWTQATYDDTDWTDMVVPGYWKYMKGKLFSDVAWYRKTFILPDYLKDDNSLLLILGKIDDFDETYLNGKLIGQTNDGRPYGWSQSYDKYRVYSIPINLLKKEGENVIAVRVKDIGTDAGIYKGPIGITPTGKQKQFLQSSGY